MKLDDNFLLFFQISVIPYEITVFTGDVKEAGIDNDVTVTIYGRGGATPEVKLEKGDEKFGRGTVDMFEWSSKMLESCGRLGLDTKTKEIKLAGI